MAPKVILVALLLPVLEAFVISPNGFFDVGPPMLGPPMLGGMIGPDRMGLSKGTGLGEKSQSWPDYGSVNGSFWPGRQGNDGSRPGYDLRPGYGFFSGHGPSSEGPYTLSTLFTPSEVSMIPTTPKAPRLSTPNGSTAVSATSLISTAATATDSTAATATASTAATATASTAATATASTAATATASTATTALLQIVP